MGDLIYLSGCLDDVWISGWKYFVSILTNYLLVSVLILKIQVLVRRDKSCTGYQLYYRFLKWFSDLL